MDVINVKKTLVGCVVSCVLGAAPTLTSAAPIVKIVVEDVGSTVVAVDGSNVFSPVQDGNSGGFTFSTLDPVTYINTLHWFSDIGPMLWGGATNPTGSFSTGFLLGGFPFVPYTFGNGAVGEINHDLANCKSELVVNSLDFGGNFYVNEVINFNQPMDIPPGVQVNWVVDNGDGTYKTSLQWEHTITAEDDPSGAFVGNTGHWIIEGTATVDLGTVPDQISALISAVMGIDLSKGIQMSMDAKLDSAFRALDDVNTHNDQAAINSLNGLINHANAQRGNKIDETAAECLIDEVQRIIGNLGG